MEQEGRENTTAALHSHEQHKAAQKLLTRSETYVLGAFYWGYIK